VGDLMAIVTAGSQQLAAGRPELAPLLERLLA
jgi:hypothetical protein